jgi:uncharacterized protein (DUF1778 family)
MKPQEPSTSRLKAPIAPEALDAAQRAVDEVEVIRFSPEAQEKFIPLLMNPPPPSEALSRALERHRSLIVK